MKLAGSILMALLFWVVFIGYLPTAAAQNVYLDPVNGDNRNPGISSATAKKSTPQVGSDICENLAQTAEAMPWNKIPYSVSPDDIARGNEEMTRIILGSETLTGWDAFSKTIWQAPFELDQEWSLDGVRVNDGWLTEGCSAFFLDHRQYHFQSNMLFLNDPEGNPDDTGKTVNALLYNFLTDEYSRPTITGWTLSPPSVWQIEFPAEPMHVFINNMSVDSNWWYGPLQCEQETGQAGYLYLKDAEGNPDAQGKTVAAVVDSGGWDVTAGDFNGDGFQDVVHSNNGAQIYINYGAPEFSATPGQILDSPEEGVPFGFFVASAGDVNHDHFDDLIVAMGWGGKAAYLYMGSASGLKQPPDLTLAPPATVTAYGFGHGIAGNGDINGDGYTDILVMGGDDTGSYLCVYLGSADGMGPDPDSVITYPGKIYGGSVCIVGDMNCDGFDEVAVSLNNPPPVSNIVVDVYRGSPCGRLVRPSRLRIDIPETTSAVHGEVAAAGDVNGDGFADLVIGNQWAGGEFENQGEAYLVLGPVCRRLIQPDLTIENPSPEFNARFGSIVAGVGYFNQDGIADIGIGCPYGEAGGGYVAVFTGSRCNISNEPTYIITGTDGFGWSLSEAGHLNCDGKRFLAAGEDFGGSYLYALPGDAGRNGKCSRSGKLGHHHPPIFPYGSCTDNGRRKRSPRIPPCRRIPPPVRFLNRHCTLGIFQPDTFAVGNSGL